MKRFVTCAALVAIAMLACLTAAAKEPLRFNKDGKLKIVQFTDIHWQYGNDSSLEAERNMNAVLDAEKPDLVVITGDLVYSAPARKGIVKALAPTAERGIPFLVAYGNHDSDFDATREELFEIISSYPTNYTDSAANLTGVTNCVQEILPSDGSDKPAALIYIMDSNSYTKVGGVDGYAGFGRDQVEWYGNESARRTAANGGEPLPALAFFHVPLSELNELASTENALLRGTRRERACTPMTNTGMMAEMVKCGDVMATFVGHDHINDYCVASKGILLGYGRYSGGKTVYCDMPGGPGARVIELKEGERAFDSWIRLADGRVIDVIAYPHDFTRWKASPTE